MSATFEKPLNLTARDPLTEGLASVWDVNLSATFTPDGRALSPELLELLPYASAIAIPCGVHTGHPVGLLAAVQYANQHHLAIGAEVGLPPNADSLTDEELKAWFLVQIGALQALAQSVGTEVHYIRPARPLYDDFFVAAPPRLTVLAKTIAAINPWLMLLGPSGDTLNHLATETQVRTVGEVHLGKRYRDNGEPILYDPARFLHGKAMMDQMHQLIQDGTLTTQSGKPLAVKAASLHVDPALAHVENTLKNLKQKLQNPVPLPVAAAAPSGWV